MVCLTRERKPALMCEEGDESSDPAGISDTHEGTEEDAQEERLEGSTLPSCVIRRMLTGQKTEEFGEEEWLRTNIFHTCVEHHGKALNLIIDNGNGMNVISQVAVIKLKCPMEKHPNLIRLVGSMIRLYS